MKLNPQQFDAIHYLDSPLLVLAGAGSGKTRVITEKMAYLVNELNYPECTIAAITFTNKAAEEMRARIAHRVSKPQDLNISTFHALGLKIIRHECAHLGLKERFSIFDAADSFKLIAELADDDNKDKIARLQNNISLYKNALISPDEAICSALDTHQRESAEIYARYCHTMKSYHAVDFDDLIALPCALFAHHHTVREHWQKKFRYLLVDECQDTNSCQYALMHYLVGEKANFTAVGDDDQSIYAWRGADIENLRRMQHDYPSLKIIKLEQNYRSTPRILRVANAVIANNPRLFEKTLWSDVDEGESVRILTCKDENHEAQLVASCIRSQQYIHKCRYTDFAILYRSNHQARLFEESLRAAHIPYRISGGKSFFDRTEIKDVLSYIRLIANTNDDPAFLRAITSPKRGIGEQSLHLLNEIAAQHQESLFDAIARIGNNTAFTPNARAVLHDWAQWIARLHNKAKAVPVGDLMHQILEDSGYEKDLRERFEGKSGDIRWKSILDLIQWLSQKNIQENKNLFDLVHTISLMTIIKDEDKNSDSVLLSTLHASKGLEFPFVFLVGCEEGLLPHENSFNAKAIEEERRLMYVGITRARQNLTLSHARKRRRNGHWEFSEISRFLSEMPQTDLTDYDPNRKLTPTQMRALLDTIEARKNSQ